MRLPSPVRGEPRFVTAGEVTSLIHHTGEEGISVAVLAFTGLRFGELAALRVRRVFDPSCRALGLTDVSPHDLRHTAASLAIQRGANVKAVQRMLGHAQRR